MTTSEVAHHARVNKQTVRYYERRGLLPEPPRNDAGHRQYDREAVRRLYFIKRAQKLGFSLDAIGELLSLRYARGPARPIARSSARRAKSSKRRKAACATFAASKPR